MRYLHFGTESIQGAMRLKKPDSIELEYAQQMMAWMLFLDHASAPLHIAQLGLGAASLTKFCYRLFSEPKVTAVELNPDVIAAARTMFRLPVEDERLSVIEGDAWDYVGDAANSGQLDVLQVDLYDASARGPVLDSAAFYQACRACLREPGVITVNLFGDHPSFAKNMKALRAAFDGRVVALPDVHEGNRIAIAFTGASVELEWAELYCRADSIESRTGLSARTWVDGLRESESDKPNRPATARMGPEWVVTGDAVHRFRV